MQPEQDAADAATRDAMGHQRRIFLLFVAALFSSALYAPAFAQEGEAPEGAEEEADGEEELPPITKLPKIKALEKAKYPPEALKEGITAEVVLEIDISAEGEVEGVRVLTGAEPEGYGFDEAAVEAIFLFEFEPAETAEGPIPVTITYKYRFTIEEKKVEKPIEPDKGDGEDKKARDPVVNYQGQLLERGTRTPMRGIPVIVFRGEGDDLEGYESITDGAGRFEFYDLPEGPWKVLVELEGYYPFKTTESVETSALTEVVYYIEKGSYNPFDVLVEGTRARKEVTRRTLTIEEIEKIPGNFGDPIRVVQNLPGVARTRFGDGRIVVRGSSPEDTRVYVNSVQVPLIYHFGGIRSVIPAGMIKSIDFLPGNFGVRYGRAIGGVLDVDLKSLRPEAVHGYVDVNVFDSGVYLEAPVGEEFSFAVAARRSYIDVILNAAIPENAPVNVIAAPRYYDFQVLGTWRPNPSHTLKLFFFASDDELELLFDNPSEVSATLRSGSLVAGTFFMRGIAEHDWVPTETFKNELHVAVGQDVVGASLGDQFFVDLSVVTAQLRDEAELTISKQMTLKTGLDLQLSFIDINIRAPLPNKEGDIRGDRDFTETITANEEAQDGSPAAFFEFELQPFDGMLIIPGVRAELFLPMEEFVFAPRLTVRYEANEQWTLKGGAGLYHQPPTPDETSSAFGNPDLGPEEAIHYALGAEWRPLPHLTIDTTFFFKDLRDLVARSTETVERGGELVPEIYDNEGIGRVFGLELLIRHEFANNFFGWITYTISRAERLDPGEDTYRLFDFDQTHILTLVGSYRLPRNWEIGLRWRLTSGNPLTPIEGSVYNSDNDDFDRVFGAVNSDRLPAFHQLDLRVDKTWIYDTWKLNVYMDVQNAYNRSNIEGFQFNFDFTETRPQQGLPVIPALGIKATF